MSKGTHRRRWVKILAVVIVFDVVLLLLDALLVAHYWPVLARRLGIEL